VLAQIATPGTEQAAGTIEALDAKNGFRSYKFGTPKAGLQGLKERSKGVYVAPAEPLKVGEAKLMGLYFGLYDDKLANVVMGAFGDDNCQKLLAALRAQYGPGEQVSSTRIVWQGQLVTMTFEAKQTYSAYTGVYSTIRPSNSCTVSIMSNEAIAAEKAAKDAAAKKAGGDL
jgi:hypothetical protein